MVSINFTSRIAVCNCILICCFFLMQTNAAQTIDNDKIIEAHQIVYNNVMKSSFQQKILKEGQFLETFTDTDPGIFSALEEKAHHLCRKYAGIFCLMLVVLYQVSQTFRPQYVVRYTIYEYDKNKTSKIIIWIYVVCCIIYYVAWRDFQKQCIISALNERVVSYLKNSKICLEVNLTETSGKYQETCIAYFHNISKDHKENFGDLKTFIGFNLHIVFSFFTNIGNFCLNFFGKFETVPILPLAILIFIFPSIKIAFKKASEYLQETKTTNFRFK